MSPDTPTVTSWTLVLRRPNAGNPPSVDIWQFLSHDEHNIQVLHNGAVDVARYANGYYSVAEARTMWGQLVDKGYQMDKK